ncbi:MULTISPECIES: hypothetical protein [Nocardia]|uniref:hypothetical protein n=1 Tax=Nocardia TaxID=1817 RepID=UPI0007A4BA00|nr:MULTISPECIES: hypothetical protein [Nocardia]
MSEIELDASGRDDFNKAARALGRNERQLGKHFPKDLTKVAKELAKKASAEALAQPALKGKHTGLRQDVAKGVDVVPWDDGIRVQTKMPEEDEAIIPRGLDTFFKKGWRHPLFGQRGKGQWFTQRGGSSWFMDTMQDAEPLLSEKFQSRLDAAADDIDRSVGG